MYMSNCSPYSVSYLRMVFHPLKAVQSSVFPYLNYSQITLLIFVLLLIFHRNLRSIIPGSFLCPIWNCYKGWGWSINLLFILHSLSYHQVQRLFYILPYKLIFLIFYWNLIDRCNIRIAFYAIFQSHSQFSPVFTIQTIKISYIIRYPVRYISKLSCFRFFSPEPAHTCTEKVITHTSRMNIFCIFFIHFIVSPYFPLFTSHE